MLGRGYVNAAVVLSMSGSISAPHFYIKTKWLIEFSSNLANVYEERINPIDLEVKGQNHWQILGCEGMLYFTLPSFQDERMNQTVFRSERS